MKEFINQAPKTIHMEKTSMEKDAYLEIRQMILKGLCLPGTMLSENELAKHLNMSRTPIRAAITVLENEGFVQSIRGRGVLVKEMSSQEFAQMYEVLVSMQIFVLDMAARRGLSFDLESMQQHLEAQIKASDAGDFPAYYESNFCFIETMLRPVQNQNMLQVFENMRGKFIFKMVSSRGMNEFSLPKTNQGRKTNLRIYEALEQNDIEEAKNAVYALNDHIYKNVYSYDI